MIPVDQTVYEDPQTGNCFQAAIASILELSIEQVPRFFEDDWWFELVGWAQTLGLEPIWCPALPENFGGFCIAVGTAPRTQPDIPHAVVWKDGKVVHDPYPPSRDGLIGEPQYFVYFAVWMD